MADVKFTMGEATLSRNPVSIRVYDDDRLLGTLQIRRAGLAWFTLRATTAPEWPWKRFADFLQGKKASPKFIAVR